MHARVVSMEILSTDMGEAVRIYQDSVLPAAKEERGYRGALMLTDPYTGEGSQLLYGSPKRIWMQARPAASITASLMR